MKRLQQTLLAFKSYKQTPGSRAETWLWLIPCWETETAFRNDPLEKVNKIMGVLNVSLL